MLAEAFSNLRARAITLTKVRWGWYRKNKTETSTVESISAEPRQDKRSSTPLLPPLQLPSSGAEESWSDVEGEPIPDFQRPSPKDPVKATHNASDDHGATEDSGPPNFRNSRETDLLTLNGKLIEQQKDVSAKRLQVRESRMALRYKREEELELRANLMKRLNHFFANHAYDLLNGELILREYELLQVATAEYLTMENSYHQEEDQLEQQEYMLTLSMESVAGISGKGPLPDIQGQGSQTLGTWDPLPEHSPIPETPQCIVNYLSRIGDERMLQERLLDLESEWFITIEKQTQRHHLQLPLDKESEDFLQTFDERRIKIRTDLTHAQLDVVELRDICLEQGYKDFDYKDLAALNQFMEETVFEQNNKDPLKLSPQEEFTYSPELKIDQDQAASSNPGYGTAAKKSDLEQKKPFGSTEFIKTWMLHQLRISSVGIWQLQLLVDWQPLRDQGWRNEDISQHILDQWFADEVTTVPSTSSDWYLNGENENSNNRSEKSFASEHDTEPRLDQD